MEDKTIMSIAAIVCLAALECCALLIAHVDGAILMTVGALIAGIAGYEMKNVSAGKTIAELEAELEKLKASG